MEEQYSVNIYFIAVAFDINLGVISCSLLAGGVFRCPSGLSCVVENDLHFLTIKKFFWLEAIFVIQKSGICQSAVVTKPSRISWQVGYLKQ